MRRCLALLLCLLSAPALAEPVQVRPVGGFNGPLAAAVFATALAFMAPRTLEPIPLDRLTLWGLRGLTALDPGLTPAVTRRRLVLSAPGRILFVASAPGANDPAGWGSDAAEMAEAAWQASAAVRAGGTQGVVTSFFDELFNHLDPYSRYTPPAAAARDRLDRSGRAGAGFSVVVREGRAVVGRVVPGGPAAALGITPGMRVLAVNGEPMLGAAAARVAARLQGPAGSRLMLRLESPAGVVRTLLLTRARVPPPTVFAHREGALLTLRITGFSGDTARLLAAALRRGIEGDHPPAGVVLDLRDNRGGLLVQAVRAAAALVPHGVLAVTAGRDPYATHVWRADGQDLAAGLPVVVLVDGRTASAAEVLAAALADHRRAVVVGSETLGKGLVQTVTPLPDGGELFVTWSRVLAPLGWPLQGLGVMPQVCTSLDAGAFTREIARLQRGIAPMAKPVAEARAARAPLPLALILAIRSLCPAALGTARDAETARFLIDTPRAYQAALLPAPPAGGAR